LCSFFCGQEIILLKKANESKILPTKKEFYSEKVSGKYETDK